MHAKHQHRPYARFSLVAFCLILSSALMPYNLIAAEEFSETRVLIEQAGKKAIAAVQTPDWPCGSPFEIGTLVQGGQWAFLTFACWPATNEDPVDVIVPAVILFATAYDARSGWQVFLEGTPEFSSSLADLPSGLLDDQSKAQILASPVDLSQIGRPASALVFTTGLPWQQGTTWYYRTSIHGSNNGLDFASPCGYVGEVKAADSGTVVWAYETCILVRRSDGLEIGYQHIASADIAPWDPGDVVYRGTLLGHTTMESGCSGNTYAHHVHFWLQGQNPNGSTFGGWTLNDPYLVKGGASRYPNLGCVNGSNDIYYEGGCCGCGKLKTASKQSSAFAPESFGSSVSASCTMTSEPSAPRPAVTSTRVELSATTQPVAAFPPAVIPKPTATPQPVAMDEPHAPSSIHIDREAVKTQRTPPVSENYRIPKSVFGSGGGEKTSTSFVMNSTQGQGTDLKQRQSASYVLAPGYWGQWTPLVYDNVVYLPLVIRNH